MIELLSEPSVLEKLTARDPFGVRIASDYKGYGIGGSIHHMIWVQDEAAAVSLRGDKAVICGDIRNIDELKGFLAFISPENIICSRDTAEKLGLEIIQQGELMRREAEGKCAEIPVDYTVCVKSAAALLYECGMEFDPAGFFSEVSHAVHRGIGMVETLFDGEKLCACAVSVNISGDSALINGVAVDKTYRRAGMGTDIMNKIAGKLCGRTLFVYKETGKYGVFYEKLGFKYCGNWAVGKLEGQ